ncbi:MAG: serine hydrolase, partial [Bacteroidota bacterium]
MFFSLPLLLSSCHVVRYVWWNFADINDYRKFPADTLLPGPSPYHFRKSDKLLFPYLPVNYTPKERTQSIEDFLEERRTSSFIIIRNDTILYEKYFGKYNHNSIFPGFSITKSFVSALTGIAIDEGKIKSIHQAVTDFLPDMVDTNFRKVTIEDLLTMRSGIRFTEGYTNPFGGMAKFYYGKNLKRYTKNLKVEREPGNSYRYQSANTQILVMILEKAMGMRISEYIQEKLWSQMGMEFPGTWNYDSKKQRQNKGFCCINARSVDFAKFGNLYLQQGKMDGRQLVPENWVKESLTVKNDSKDSQGFSYTYGWRVLPNGDFFAKGILGEFI